MNVTPKLCPERCSGGMYAGWVCCAGPVGHDGPHTITVGHHEPPGYRVAYEWPVSTSPTRNPDASVMTMCKVHPGVALDQDGSCVACLP